MILKKMLNTNDNHKSMAIFCGAMTFSWLIAWASFTAAPLLGRRFSLVDAFVSFAAAAFINARARNRHWRNYRMVGLNLLGLAGMLMHTLHASFYATTGFFSRVWLGALGAQMHTVPGFMIVCLVAGWVVVFWVSGAKLGRHPLNYVLICNRFDTGLTAFFALLLVQLVLVVRGGLTIAAPPDAFFMYTFFICGLMAIGLARHHGMAEKEFLPGLRGVAILLMFAIIILTATGLVATLAPPILTPIAEDGYVVLKTVAGPLGPIITRILLFIFGRNVDYSVTAGGATGSTGELLPDQTAGQGLWLARLVAEGFFVVLALGMLTLIGFAVWRIVRWLLQRETGVRERRQKNNHLFELLRQLWAWLQYGLRVLRIYLAPPRDIGRLFAGLQAWGRLSGVHRRIWETPKEYGERLGLRFPQTAGEIDTIVGAFQQQVYGEMTLDTNAISKAYAAWRRLRSPLQWPSRWRALITP